MLQLPFFPKTFSYCFSVSTYLQVESVLDKENFTLEELLDEEEIIQECKALNSRLINLLVLSTVLLKRVFCSYCVFFFFFGCV